MADTRTGDQIRAAKFAKDEARAQDRQIARVESQARARVQAQAQQVQDQLDAAQAQVDLDKQQLRSIKKSIGSQRSIRNISRIDRAAVTEQVSAKTEEAQKLEGVIKSSKQQLDENISSANKEITKEVKKLGQGERANIGRISIETVPAQRLAPIRSIDFVGGTPGITLQGFGVHDIPIEKIEQKILELNPKFRSKLKQQQVVGNIVKELPLGPGGLIEVGKKVLRRGSERLESAPSAVPKFVADFETKAINFIDPGERKLSEIQKSREELIEKQQKRIELNLANQLDDEFLTPEQIKQKEQGQIFLSPENFEKNKAQEEFEKFQFTQLEQAVVDVGRKRQNEFLNPFNIPKVAIRGGARAVIRAPGFVLNVVDKPLTTTLGVVEAVDELPGAVVTDPALGFEVATGIVAGRAFGKKATSEISTAIKGETTLSPKPISVGADVIQITKLDKAGTEFKITGEGGSVTPGRTKTTTSKFKPTKTEEAPPRTDIAVVERPFIVDKLGDVIKDGIIGSKKVSPGGVAGKQGPTILSTITKETGSKPVVKLSDLAPVERSLFLRGIGATTGKIQRSFIELQQFARLGKSGGTPIPAGRRVRSSVAISTSTPIVKSPKLTIEGTRSVIRDVTPGVQRASPKATIKISEGLTIIRDSSGNIIGTLSKEGVLTNPFGKVIGTVDKTSGKIIPKKTKSAEQLARQEQAIKNLEIPKEVLKKAEEVRAGLQTATSKKAPVPKSPKLSAPEASLIIATERSIKTTGATTALDADLDIQQEQILAPQLDIQQEQSLVTEPDLQTDTATTILNPTTRTFEDIRARQTTLQLVNLSQTQGQEQSLAQDTLLVSGTTLTPSSPGTTPTTPLIGAPGVPVIITPTLQKAIRKIKRSGTKAAFDVYVKTQGKFKKVANDLPIGRALKKGATVTKSTIASTFEVRRDKKAKTKLRDTKFIPSPQNFRAHKIVKGKKVPLPQGPDKFTFIEKKKRRLTTGGETRALVGSRSRKSGGLLG